MSWIVGDSEQQWICVCHLCDHFRGNFEFIPSDSPVPYTFIAYLLPFKFKKWVCMRVLVHVYMYVYKCICVSLYVGVHVCMSICVSVHTCMWVCLGFHLCMHAGVCMWMYVCMHVCFYAYMCVRVYVCMYVCEYPVWVSCVTFLEDAWKTNLPVFYFHFVHCFWSFFFPNCKFTINQSRTWKLANAERHSGMKFTWRLSVCP